MPLMQTYYSRTTAQSVMVDNRITNNSFVYIGGNNILCPSGLLDSIGGLTTFNFSRTYSGNIASMKTHVFNGYNYVSFAHNNRIYFFNTSNSNPFSFIESISLPTTPNDYNIYGNFFVMTDYSSKVVRVYNLSSSIPGFQFESNPESKYNFINPIILNPSASYSVLCPGFSSNIISTNNLSVLDTSGYSLNLIMNNTYTVTGFSCSAISLKKCSSVNINCGSLSVGDTFLQSDVDSSRVFVKLGTACSNNETVQLSFSNGFGGFLNLINLQICN